jgi:hypothetical protein
MRRRLGSLLIAAALALPLTATVFMSGCAERASVRVYDPYYSDYHVWNRDEVVYYNRWENETHRDHREFKQRKSDEQKEYWTWRHSQH